MVVQPRDAAAADAAVVHAARLGRVAALAAQLDVAQALRRLRGRGRVVRRKQPQLLAVARRRESRLAEAADCVVESPIARRKEPGAREQRGSPRGGQDERQQRERRRRERRRRRAASAASAKDGAVRRGQQRPL